LLTLVLDELGSITDRYAREHALLLGSETLSLASLLLPTLEKTSPLFLENVTLYDEPILDKIESMIEFIDTSLHEEETAVQELTRAVEDVVRTLEYHIRIGERALAKIL